MLKKSWTPLEREPKLSKDCLYSDFFLELTRATINIYWEFPEALLTLSGGLDTRLLAGILRGTNITCISKGSFLEKIIAHKVALECGLKHRTVNDLRELPLESHLILGSCFDEINGGVTAWLHLSQFYEAVEHGLQLRFKQIDASPFKLHVPILDKGVLQSLDKIPIQWRTAKQIQKYILRNVFPDLYKIPYYNSLLPPSFPYAAHVFNMKMLKRVKRRILPGET